MTTDSSISEINRASIRSTSCDTKYAVNHDMLVNQHHSRCMFNNHQLVPELKFTFNAKGNLTGNFTCTEYHQGYDTMVHGGLIAAIVDASMVQCLMGHGIVGYTANLSVKYRKPVIIHDNALLETYIEKNICSRLYCMRCDIAQNNRRVVSAHGKFYKIKQNPS